MTKPAITSRITKGAALTYEEQDANFTNLQNATITVTDGTNSKAIDLNGTITFVTGSSAGVSVDPTTGTVTIGGSMGGNLTDNIDLRGYYIKDSLDGNAEFRVNDIQISGNPGSTGGIGSVIRVDVYNNTIKFEGNSAAASVYTNGSLTLDSATLILPKKTTNPSNTTSGQLYYNSGDNSLRYYNGSSWTSLISTNITKTSWNAAIDTEITVDNYRFRVHSSTGIFPEVISNTGSPVLSSWVSVAACDGDSIKQGGNASTSILSGSWSQLYTFHGMDASGDTVVTTLLDRSVGKIYRITFIRSLYASVTGYNIIVERL